MGASISSNAASMVADAYSSSTSTTTISDENNNNSAQSIVLEGCNITSVGDISIAQTASQIQSIQQTASVQNSQISTTSINQSLLQEAQSSVSSWGIGVAAASNNMNVATSVSTSVKSAVDITLANTNTAIQDFICSNSSIMSGGDVSISQSVGQSISSTQDTSVSSLQSVTTDITQTATQTATATVSGIDFTTLIIGAIVLFVVIGIVMAIVKSKMQSNPRGGGAYKLNPLEFKLFVAGTILIVILATLGIVGLGQRPAHACDFTEQCTASASDQFWFDTSGATCTISNRYSALTGDVIPPTATLPTLVAPPLFMCNSIRQPTSVPFGTLVTVELYPGVLQDLVVAKRVNGVAAGGQQQNNSGYNMGVYSELLITATNTTSTATQTSKYIQALGTWFRRQMFTKGADGAAFVVPPDGSQPSAWCVNRILRDLLPIQPVFMQPHAGLQCTQAVDDNIAVTPAPCVSAVSALRQPRAKRVMLWQGQRRQVGSGAKAVPAGILPREGNAVRLTTEPTCNASTGTDACEYLVRLPGSFLANGLKATPSPSDATVTYVTYLCLPNAFVPTTDGTSLFKGNSTANVDLVGAVTCSASTATTTGGIAIRAGTCVQTPYANAADTAKITRPTLLTDYTCGCMALEAGEACWGDSLVTLDPTEVYHGSDNLCFVNSTIKTSSTTATDTARHGGFILRKADTFTTATGSINSTSKYDGIYGGTTTNPDLYMYAATPEPTRLAAWLAANPLPEQQRRIYMFVRIFWWLLLTVDVADRTLSELGLSTFVNEEGYDESTNLANVPLDSDDIVDTLMYGSQPLFVKQGNSFAFFTLQELREGKVSAEAASSTSVRAPVDSSATCLAQVGMWCYNPSSMDITDTLTPSEGFNTNLNTAAADSAGQISTSEGQRGLLIGRHGYCRLWFTDDAFIASTLGLACAIFVLLVAYAVAVNVHATR